MSARKRIYRGKSPDTRRSERRQQLIEAGCTVFGQVGYHAATVKQLCQAAGLTERYFYESFRKRHELFAACYDQKLDELLQGITAALSASPERSRDALARAGLSHFFQIIQDDRDLARILLVEIYGVPYDQERLFRRSIVRFSALIEQVALSQDIAPDRGRYDSELLSAGLVGVCIQMAQRWVVDGYRQPAARLVENCMLIFQGLGDRLAAATRNV